MLLRFSVNDVSALVFSIFLLPWTFSDIKYFPENEVKPKKQFKNKNLFNRFIKKHFETDRFSFVTVIGSVAEIFSDYDGTVGNQQLLGIHRPWRCKSRKLTLPYQVMDWLTLFTILVTIGGLRMSNRTSNWRLMNASNVEM